MPRQSLTSIRLLEAPRRLFLPAIMVRVRAGLLLCTCLASSPALAELSICNKTRHPVAVAVGTYEAGEWWSQGWSEVPAGACAALVPGDLTARYYYAYALHLGAPGAWDGNRSFCVKDEPFRIQGRTDCEKRGYKRAGFFEMDTKELKSWTQYLSD